MTTPGCYACGKEAEFDDLPPRECVVHDQHWRVAHAVDTAVPGRLVLLPRRHVAAVHTLTDAEGFAHAHFRIVPRMADLPPEHRGPGIFELLRRPARERVKADQADRTARSLRARPHEHLNAR
ncbi:HIT family protein [Streptomyces sp. AHU1]|uniref:HIT family protein n=1 Tax=Streptomyces sp. AHU1 TaxID=3377215 RepID=UPI0038782195